MSETERLRELATAVRSQLPEGLAYLIIVWPPLDSADVAWWSNAPRTEALQALATLLKSGFRH